ncbi:hypothetical protein V8C42DRAFT_343726 [Trichoderma barbatum]
MALLKKMSTLATLLAISVTVAGQELNKASLSPPVPTDKFSPILFEYLKETPSTVQKWEKGSVPSQCQLHTEANNLSSSDLDVYNVFYRDCDQPWVLCRHREATITLAQLVSNFGRLPVGMRDVTLTQVALPRNRTNIGAYLPTGNLIIFDNPQDPIHSKMDLWVHNTGHFVDFLSDPNEPPFSTSDEWLQAYDSDAFISDSAIAQEGQLENFAQEVLIAVFDNVVPGGIKSIAPNADGIVHQYTTIQKKFGDRLIPGGYCNRTLPLDVGLLFIEDQRYGGPDRDTAVSYSCRS